MLSIPRDMVDVPLADGRKYRDKINSLVSYARHHPAQFPGIRRDRLRRPDGRARDAAATPIDYYAKVDLGGFVRVVDILGGVNVNVARAFCDPSYDEYGFTSGFSITAGRHHLNGQQALAYARVRKASGESDFTRAARQQEVISGIRDSIVHGGFLNDPIGLLQAIGKTVETNVPRDMLPDLAELATEVGREQTYRAVVNHPLVGSGFDVRGSIQIPDVDGIRALAAKLFPIDGAPPGRRLRRSPSRRPAGPASRRAAAGSGVGGCAPAPRPKPTPTPKPTAAPTARRPIGEPVDRARARAGVGEASPRPSRRRRSRSRRPPEPERRGRSRRTLRRSLRNGGLSRPAPPGAGSVSWSHSTRNASWPLVERDLAVGGADAGVGRGIHERPHLARPVQDVVLDADPGQARRRPRRAGGAPRRGRLARADVVAVHRPDQDPVRRRVEPVDELAALVVEVADDRRPAVGLERARRTARRSRSRCGRWSSPAGGRAPGRRRPSCSMSCDLEVVPGDGHRPDRGGCRDRHHVADGVRAGPARPRARPSRRASRR